MDYSKFTDEELEKMLDDAESKARMYNTQQMSQKISINSLYGAIAAKHFSMFNEKIAQSITGNGRFFIRLLANNIEAELQKMIPSKKPYIIYGDTDSVYFQICDFVEKYTKDKDITTKVKWSNAFYNKVINKIVQETIDDFSEKLNAYDSSFIGSEREIISDSGIFVAKKKYTARVLDLEGKHYPIDNPYMKTQGLQSIQGGTAPFAKKYLKESVPVILDEDGVGVQRWFQSTRNKFLQEAEKSLDNIAKTQGVSKIEDPKWGTTQAGRKVSIPFGSRVAVVTNEYIKKHNLEEQYQMIQAGDKVKMLYLNEPNPLSSNAFGYIDSKFAELFKDYIDYDTNFEKFFESALEALLEATNNDVNASADDLDAW